LNFEEWDLGFLMDYIIHIHHDYIKKALPLLIESLKHFAEGHRKKFAYLDELISLVSDLNREMLPHNAREEESVFPYIRKIKHAYENKEPYAGLLVRTLSKPMRDMMKHDHNMVVEFLMRIRELTNNYALPPQACTNHKVNFQLLKEMDDDLMQHLRLETQILFPKAIQMERELLQSS
jgi:regulator of cell morphogenesis and NO signaling